MSSILTTSQGVVLAAAMAAVSGTAIILAFRLQKTPPRPILISSSEGMRKKKKKSNKRVHFAEDVADPSGDGVEFRKRRNKKFVTKKSDSNSNSDYNDDGVGIGRMTGTMPANRVALYSGMLRDRVGQRLAY